MIIEPLKPAHLERINPRGFEAKELKALGNLASCFSENAFAGLVDGMVVGIAGVHVLWSGVATGFLITSHLVERYKLSFHRAIRRGLEVMRERHGLWRIQVDVHVEHPTSHKWVQRLGFKPEGLMEQYGPDGSDYVRYARLWREIQ